MDWWNGINNLAVAVMPTLGIGGVNYIKWSFQESWKSESLRQK